MKSIIFAAITALSCLASAMEGMNGFRMSAMDPHVSPRYKFRIRGENQYFKAPSPSGGPGAPKAPSKSPSGAPGSPGSPKSSPSGGCEGSTCGAGYKLTCKGGKPSCSLNNLVAACKAQGGAYMNTYTDKNGNECCNHCDGSPSCGKELKQAQETKHPCGKK
ncbi:uncharacterized protein MYCFIDRAFT_186249 [Pseudocercospora fijiensis CIRAD86]|uniref:Uncharacterized protein n=1 Tax=Pseudocercospora fijiensis (strain CIRAD86) TaxID=383855 RepID=M3B935_PSEFD|nr:uncharacterized protein MYCFIDRAFT_186249 [Pseudocercospora fijiensis CIRAD86]EME85763.1 hypothetical protein MYCFIDRAFT_186249 [Pseudocercospora fijiensis CIRAD86]